MKPERYSIFILDARAGLRLEASGSAAQEGTNPEQILLKDHKPVSIHRTPVTVVPEAGVSVVGVHSRPCGNTPAEMEVWHQVMAWARIEKSVVMIRAWGKEFDALFA